MSDNLFLNFNAMKGKTGLFIVLSVLSAAAVSVLMTVFLSGDSDAATIGRKKETKTDREGHVLVKLWDEYNDARSDDRPLKEAGILDEIIRKSVAGRLPWDFYDASCKWFHSVVSRNWKLGDESLARISADAAGFGSPVVDYNLALSGLLDVEIDRKWLETNVLDNAASLKQSCCRSFYANDRILSSSDRYARFITDLISNDYEYLLWSLSRQSGRYGEDDGVREAAEKALKDYLGDSYPAGTYLEYLDVLDMAGGPDIMGYVGDEDVCPADSMEVFLQRRHAFLEGFACRYEGRAISLYALEQMLVDRKRVLDAGRSGHAGLNVPESSDYRELGNDCDAFISLLGACRGEEKRIADCLERVPALADELDSRSVGMFTDGYEVGAVFRNVDKALLELRKNDEDGEIVHSAEIVNAVGSYYLPDTVKCHLPRIPDGDYVLVCRYGKDKSMLSFPVSSLSVAGRSVRDSGYGIYPAWQDSGKPVENADIEIISKGETVKTVKGFSFDGFTSVQGILDAVSAGHDGALRIRCSFTDDEGLYRRSPSLFVSENDMDTGFAGETAPRERRTEARIFKDRGAFNPGDSVQFKVVLFSHSGGKDYAVEPDRDMNVWLAGPDGKTVAEEPLKTDTFGSAAGVFGLPEGLKGGTYYISVNVPGSSGFIARSALTLDEFVLPNYTMEFMDDSLVWFPGDTVIVRGRLSGYSGHSVSAARIGYSMESYSYGVEPVHGETTAADDGTFEIRFKAGSPSGGGDRSYWYYPSVKVTDLTGETYEWSGRPVYVNPKMTLSASLLNEAEGYADMLPGYADERLELMSCDTARLRFRTFSGMPECPVEYSVTRDGHPVLTGSAVTGEEVAVDLSGHPSGIYRVGAKAVYTHHDGRRLEDEYSMALLKTSVSDTAMDYGVESFIRKIDDGSVSALVGVGDGEQWFVVEVYDAAGRLLRSETVRMNGRNGSEDSVRLISCAFDGSWTDVVTMRIFGFRNGKTRTDCFTYGRAVPAVLALPLEFTRFADKTMPGTRVGISMKTLPGTECLVSVYDKSADNIRGNGWSAVRYREESPADIRVRVETGGTGRGRYGDAIPFQLVEESSGVMVSRPMLRSKSIAADNAAVMDGTAVSGNAEGLPAEVSVRDRFDKTLAFLPLLHPDDDGDVEFDVDVTDRLSTYYVSVFAHDRCMRNAVLRKEMVVSLPVKVSVTEPRFLYEGDRYCLKASVSNASENPLSGNMELYVYGSEDYRHSEPLMVGKTALSVGAGSASAAEFAVDVPAGADTLGFKIVYTADMDGVSVSDAMFVPVPVLEPVQTLTEAHSSVFLPGMDKDSLKRALGAAFSGTSSAGAEYRETSLMDMLLESVPVRIEPKAKDVLSLSEAYYMGRLSSVIRAGESPVVTVPDKPGETGIAGWSDGKLLESILACQNSDGGFGWFEGFPSSPVITAVVLERFAMLRDRGLCPAAAPADSADAFDRTETPGVGQLSKAVSYLDSLRFGKEYPLWYGGISLSQYLYLRSMYPDVAFSVTAGRKLMKEFASAVKDYLLPKKDRGLNDNILGKARRAAVLMSLSRPESKALALSFGLKRKDIRKLASSADADMLSLMEYAVQHPSGGVCFPNAVLPFRGLLESEVYAHSLLCDLLERYSEAAVSDGRHGAGKISGPVLSEKASGMADGIRLWLMLQKETQHWEADPAYLNAVTSVLDGSDAVKSALMAVMTKRYAESFDSIEAAGNEMSVERCWYRVVSGIREADADSLSMVRHAAHGEPAAQDRRPVKMGGGTWMIPLADGDTLNVGDRIVAQYRIWSRENRSFVQMVSPYYASLRPVDQLSGRTGGWFRPVMVSGTGASRAGITPCGYREVRSDRTVYWFDVCPEENVGFNEEFFVTQAGTFTSPAVSIECLYSPHYRANGPASARFVSE